MGGPYRRRVAERIGPGGGRRPGRCLVPGGRCLRGCRRLGGRCAHPARHHRAGLVCPVCRPCAAGGQRTGLRLGHPLALGGRTGTHGICRHLGANSRRYCRRALLPAQPHPDVPRHQPPPHRPPRLVCRAAAGAAGRLQHFFGHGAGGAAVGFPRIIFRLAPARPGQRQHSHPPHERHRRPGHHPGARRGPGRAPAQQRQRAGRERDDCRFAAQRPGPHRANRQRQRACAV